MFSIKIRFHWKKNLLIVKGMMQENIQITEFTNVEIFFINIKFQQIF